MGAFSGLIGNNLTIEATAREPWRWLFIVEGVAGIIIGLVTWILLPRSPDKIRGSKSKLLTRKEADLAAIRLACENRRYIMHDKL